MSRVVLAAGLTLAVALSSTACGGRRPPPAPTFSRDVATIVYGHCSTCHRPGQSAPFSLLSYADARAHAPEIRAAVTASHMPPWPPDASGPAFVGARSLSAADRATIDAWVDQGAVEGDARETPSPPRFTEGWEEGTPSLVVRPAAPYLVEPGGRDVYRNLVVRVPLASRRFVRAVEFRPGSAPVHHAAIHLDRTSGSRRKDGADGHPGFDGMGGPGTEDPEGQFLGWAPGRGPIEAPTDMAWSLEPGTDLVLEVHLLPVERETPVQPSVALYFTDTPPSRVPATVMMGSKAIDIPPGAAAHTLHDSFVVPVDVDLLSLYPHAHYLGHEVVVTATRPGGPTTVLLHIPHWSFHWQQDYRLVEPVGLPRGTRVDVTFSYDNSAANPDNPSHPPVRVRAGPRATDEMGNLLLQVVPHASGDRVALAVARLRHGAEINAAAGEMLVRADPADAGARRLLGGAYADLGRIPEAVTTLTQAVRLAPLVAEAHNDLAGALLLARQPQEAVGEFRTAVRLNPNDEYLHFNLAKVLEALGHGAEARDELRAALALNPEFADAFDQLGIVAFENRQLADAQAAFRHAVALAPDSAVFENDLGGALAEAGAFAEALTHVRHALMLAPDYAPARENLARLSRVVR
jgi:Flp pilus assembly protein TadD